MFRKILAAFDGSEGSWKALRAAIQLATERRAELWALSVEEHLPHFAGTVGEVLEEKELADSTYARLQAQAARLAEAQHVTLHGLVRAGHVEQTIVEAAQEGGFDLLVLGHTGHSGVWGTFLGTTTDKVSRHAPCSVLIVR